MRGLLFCVFGGGDIFRTDASVKAYAPYLSLTSKPCCPRRVGGAEVSPEG